MTITASQPRNATAPPVQTISSAANFRDQHVIEIGLAYDYNKDTMIMAGTNYGSRPIDDQHVNPIFAPIQARHYMFGVSRKISDGWQVSGGVELFTLQSSTYDSPLFGPGATERHYGYIFHTALSRHW
jgi:long-subunit fatty acid transport protein